MPPRAYPTRKKFRPEVQYDELQQALLHVASQPSTQPSTSQPSTEQPSSQPSAAQPSAQPSAEQPSAQPSHSPPLPLVLPTPSTNSTTGSTTGAGLPVRSIRSRHAVAEATISGMQASYCNKKRGVVTGKKTAVIVRTSGKSRVTYDPAVSGPPKEVRSRLVSDLSAYLKDRAPMLYPTFGEMPLSERTMLFDYLSIQKKAADRFKDWKYNIHKNWQAQGDAPIPVEFIHRPDQWQWLCNHFKAEDFQELGTQMTQIRASENKKAHSGGAQAFVLRAHDLKQKGDQAPHLTTYVEVYKKYDPDHASARTAEVEKMMADLPPIDEASDGTSPASALALVLSYETQVSVLERVVGPSRGTRVRGLGSGSAKLPRKRGPSSQTDSDTSIELVAEVTQLRANQVAIHEQLQRERAERERERVDFERKLQAQIEYVIRAAEIQPLFDWPTMSDVPEDILADILSGLTVKILLQFRCVSKQWCALISSDDFIKSHLTRSIEANTNCIIVIKTVIAYIL
ncbi:hypothetical protein LguiB_032216 [Lonicera macranthoides]